ncbi:unnamed protein product [Rotaria magnacalcarata]|uniref:Uncharacterized protein n=1 Tax=Rotaria magnacalcarata TaxID=392030 RepID=A0A815WZP7_9BILA|nr:unnamed protein product [Rotaria magnacalcarata]CAF1552631.1 unnamed protein product [Rotaria magnacalcarata]CAF2027867.1 unnamed protein product [Rotaria magnacalcarata]CAF2157479.1 unnamed protein product [Rotaria magnacalcarata]CAF2162043.1 unnamed protein product [Rotaria magnacalcarata]
MRLLGFILLFIELGISTSDEFEKYGLLREKCQRTPTNSDCVQLALKFSELLKKCQKIKTQEQVVICQQIKLKVCAIFPLSCNQPSTKKILSTTQQTITISKLIKTTKKVAIATATAAKIKTTITTTAAAAPTEAKTEKTETITKEEFVKVPIDPEQLRVRGEYCIRNGKEKKCQELLTNLKNTYSSCSKKKPTTAPTKPEQLDCHSFQGHLCKAFPKFPPCIKKTQN